MKKLFLIAVTLLSAISVNAQKMIVNLNDGKKVEVPTDIVSNTTTKDVAADLFAGHEYVDLGLPSGTLWATCNVGATKPEEFGLFYKWGSHSGVTYDSGINQPYEWLDQYGELVKYTLMALTYDKKYILDLEDDIARIEWGGEWRYPTVDESNELLEVCTKEETVVNGVEGWTLTGPNHNSIFIPKAGFLNGGKHSLSYNGCWTSTKYFSSQRTAPRSAFCLYLNTMWDSDIAWAFPVRPVVGNNMANSPSLTVNFKYGAKEVIAVNNIANIKYDATAIDAANGHDYVDLGLPSGTLWATCNIGATKPEDKGLFFAWGETEGYTEENGAGHALPLNYKWYDQGYTKYCFTASRATRVVDTKDVLNLEDDAANANWGGYWRMPNHDEMLELKTNCTWTYETVNGVNGYKAVGPNGNSIFLPAAGMFSSNEYGEEFVRYGLSAIYWSSSRYWRYYDGEAEQLVLDKSYPQGFNQSSLSSNSRYFGCSVRAVLKK